MGCGIDSRKAEGRFWRAIEKGKLLGAIRAHSVTIETGCCGLIENVVVEVDICFVFWIAQISVQQA